MSLRKHSSFLKLFPPTRPLEFVAIDILGPLARTTQGNRFLLVISDRFSKLTKTVPLKRITAYTIARAFCDQWVFVYGAPVYLLSDNGRQFTAKFFQEVCTKMGIRNLFTTTYHPQTNGQVERFNRTILAGLRRFASEDQKHWDVFSNAVTFAYNTQVHSSTGCSPFELVLSRPPGPLAMQAIASSTVAGEQPQQVRQRFIERISRLVAKARESLSASQARYKRNFDSRVNPAAPLVPGQAVYLRRERKAEDKLLPSHKLKPKVYGPFEVIRTNSHTVTIDRDGLLDKVSKDRVVLAPIKQGVLQHVLVEDEPEEESRMALIPPPPRPMIGQEGGYSASTVDCAVKVCLRLLHDIAPSARINTYPLVDFLEVEAAVLQISSMAGKLFRGLEELMAGRLSFDLVHDEEVRREFRELRSAAFNKGYEVVFPSPSQVFQLPASFLAENGKVHVVVDVPIVPIRHFNDFDLYHYHSVPFLLGNQLVRVRSTDSLLAVNKDKSQFMEIFHSQLKGCLHLGKTVLCRYPGVIRAGAAQCCLRAVFEGNAEAIF